MHSQDTKIIMSQARSDWLLTHKHPMQGKHLSDETKKKISETKNKKFLQSKPKGKTSLTIKIRVSSNYKIWRKKIFKRDKNQCVKCGSKTNLIPHHIISLRTIIRTFNIKSLQDAYKCRHLWSVKNGQTLCSNCHLLTENYGNKNAPGFHNDGEYKTDKELLSALSAFTEKTLTDEFGI